MNTSTAPSVRAIAEECLAAITAVYADEIEAGAYPQPKLLVDTELHRDVTRVYGSPAAVVWEGGPHEWAMRVHGGVDEELHSLAVDAGMDTTSARRVATTGAVKLPDGVEVEPYYSFVLCITPTD